MENPVCRSGGLIWCLLLLMVFVPGCGRERAPADSGGTGDALLGPTDLSRNGGDVDPYDPPPRCAVSTRELSFGTVPLETLESRSFWIVNRGGRTLEVQLGPIEAPFFYVGQQRRWKLPAGEGLELRVGLLAHAPGEYTCTIDPGTGCDGVICTATVLTEVPPETGSIAGVAMLPAGVPGDLNGARVAIFRSLNDWNNDIVFRQTTAVGSGPTVTYQLSEVPIGTYFLDVWKDGNGNGAFDSGDFYGVYGMTNFPIFSLYPIEVVEGQTSQTSVVMIVLP